MRTFFNLQEARMVALERSIAFECEAHVNALTGYDGDDNGYRISDVPQGENTVFSFDCGQEL